MPEERIIESFFDADNLESNDLKVPEVKPRTRRTRNRAVLEKAVQPKHLGTIVKRKKLFDSRTDAAATFGDDGVVAIANNGSLSLRITITDEAGRLWMLVPEVSVFVQAVSSSNEWPRGSFFTGADAISNRTNYDVYSEIMSLTSTDSVIIHNILVVNRTGASANIGLIIGMRYIVNTGQVPSDAAA